MRKRWIAVYCSIVLIVSLVIPAFAAGRGQMPALRNIGISQVHTSGKNTDRIIVKFRDGTASDVENQELGKVKKAGADKISSDAYVVQPEGETSAEELVQQMQALETVEYAEPDYQVAVSSVPNDPYYAAYQTAVFGAMNVVNAWDVNAGNPGVVVAVLDTGVGYTHPDLSGQVLSLGYDAVNGDYDANDDNGHGTMCAGLIAAGINNATGIAGASACSILPVKVLRADGMGYISDIIEGIQYAVAQGADVISMSFGTTSGSQSLQEAIDAAYAAGVVLVAASGNDNAAVNYPAACSHVIAVGAVDSSQVKAYYSSYGSKLDLMAVGSNVASTLYQNGSSSYAQGSGTSFAAPYVSALAGLLLSVNSSLSPDQVEAYMEDTAKDLGTAGWDSLYGYGCVEYTAALMAAASANLTPPESDLPVPDTTPPVLTVQGSETVAVSNGSVYVDEGALAYDEADGDLTSKIVVDNPVDTLIDGVYTVTYSVSDAAGNTASATRTVTVFHNTKPVITINGVETVKVPAGTAYADAGATAYDEEDGDITSKIVVSGTVKTSRAGTYLITYSVADSQGATATASRTVIVYKNKRPSMKLVGSSRVTLPYGSSYTEAGAIAVDPDDGSLTDQIVIAGSVNPLVAGTYRIIYSVQDSGGLSASVTRTVTVKRNCAPILKLIGSKSLTVRLGSVYVDAGATAKDPEDGELTSSIITAGSVNTSVKGTYYITYACTDQYGAKATATRTVRVK